MNKINLPIVRTQLSVILTSFVIFTATAFTVGSGAALAAGNNTLTRCYSGGLSVSLGRASGAAGSTYYPLYFKNTAKTACTLYGYPGVSALRNGVQLGSAAAWEASVPEKTVTIIPGATASAVLQVTDVGVYPPSQCKPETATQLKVYPPGAYRANIISKTLEGCSVTSIAYLHVEVVR